MQVASSELTNASSAFSAGSFDFDFTGDSDSDSDGGGGGGGGSGDTAAGASASMGAGQDAGLTRMQRLSRDVDAARERVRAADGGALGGLATSWEWDAEAMQLGFTTLVGAGCLATFTEEYPQGSYVFRNGDMVELDACARARLPVVHSRGSAAGISER